MHFSKYSSKRLDLSKGRLGPGPGDYEPYTNLQNRPENLNAIEESHRYEARIPRYHEAIAKDEEKKVIESDITILNIREYRGSKLDELVLWMNIYTLVYIIYCYLIICSFCTHNYYILASLLY